MKIRFQADADLRMPIVKGVKRREPLIDFQTANEAGLEGLADPIVLKIAADEGRLLVSHDVSTMPENFASFIESQSRCRLDSPRAFIPRSHRTIDSPMGHL